MMAQRRNQMRKWGAAILVLSAFATSSVQAQEGTLPPPASPVAAPVTRSLWMDGAITVAAIGLGLFVVVRNSHRA